MDRRHLDIANYLTDGPWRKKEIVALTAEKSNKSERTARNWLEDLEEEGFVETVQISRNRVFVEHRKDRKLPLDFEIESESKVQSLLEETRQIINNIIQSTIPSQLSGDITSDSVLLSNIRRIMSVFGNNTKSLKKLEKLAENIEELDKICKEQFVVIYDEPYVDSVFDILDDLILLLNNYEDVERMEKRSNHLMQTADPAETLQTYLSILTEISLNAELIGYGKLYDPRLSERIHLLQPLIETAPDPVANEIYYLIQARGDLSQRINAFISKIQSQDGGNYTQLLTDVHSFYDADERQKLRTELRNTANKLDGPQRTVVERLCVGISDYDDSSHDRTKLRYYNRTKEKIITILSHRPEKLENIHLYSTESKSNILSNIEKLSDDGYVNKIEDRRGYYNLDQRTKESFEERRRHTPVVDRKEVNRILQRMLDWREEHVYPEGVRMYNDEGHLLQRVQQPPWLALLNLVLDCSFVLKSEDETDLFFDILDRDLKEVQKTDTYRLSMPDEIIALFRIAGLLHQRWRRGLENIHYHSELSKRIDDFKKAHNCAPPSGRKYIRNLISLVDIDEADDLFRQAVSDDDETTEDLKLSINTIYYKNNRMHTVMDFLISNRERSSAQKGEVWEELIEYSVNVPHESLSADLVE